MYAQLSRGNICLVVLVYTASGLPSFGGKAWKMKICPGQGKVREFIFSQGNLQKMKELFFFPKKSIVNRLLKIIFFINKKQFKCRNFPFQILMF